MTPLTDAARTPSRARAVAAWFPRGGELLDPDFAWRHRVVRLVLAGHVPVLAVLAVLRGHGATGAALVLAVTGALLLASCTLPGRRAPALAAALGLLACSASLDALYGSVAEAHVFVIAVVLALYQDWAVYALAVGTVVVHHGLLAPLTGSTLDGHPDRVWTMALLHAGVVACESFALVLFWRAGRFTRSAEAEALAELSAGRSSVQARLAEADRMRADLIGTVSHEFRTPLTGIRGAALTLLKRGDRLDKDSRDRLLHAVLDQQERLSRLLENMLTAAQATEADPHATAEVDGVAAEVAMLATVDRDTRVSVVVAPGTVARIDRPALHQVLANLVDNALQHGAPGAVPLVAGGQDARGVWVTVSNEGRVIDLTAAGRLFEPFTQADSGATRAQEGIGVGLYVVRRLVEVYGGSVDVRSDSGWVTVEVRLQAAAERQPSLAS
ncbi:MAG: periplasmic sensor signal transduction histidine kinase [Frankiales bacterium]|nr:periplasmic sensor signal transduction histidine kinase [Frankiales bacterium]